MRPRLRDICCQGGIWYARNAARVPFANRRDVKGLSLNIGTKGWTRGRTEKGSYTIVKTQYRFVGRLCTIRSNRYDYHSFYEVHLFLSFFLEVALFVVGIFFPGFSMSCDWIYKILKKNAIVSIVATYTYKQLLAFFHYVIIDTVTLRILLVCRSQLMDNI